MRSNPRSLRRNSKAASPAVSMVIITAATIVLVLVSGSYALQVLERQQGSSEFDTVQKSILAFDDAVRDIAWDREGSRSVRFTTNYGNMRLISEDKSFEIMDNTTGTEQPLYTVTTGVVKYSLPTSYMTLGNDYSSYILGDNRTIVSRVSDSFGQALVEQEPGFASIALNYRLRFSDEGPSIKVDEQTINYVNILVIRLNCVDLTIGTGDFDLVAKNEVLRTEFLGVRAFDGDSTKNPCVIVKSGDFEAAVPLSLDEGQVIINLVIADVRVSI